MKNYTIKQLNKGEETALPCSGIPRPVEGMPERENQYSALSRVIISGETPLTDAEITGESYDEKWHIHIASKCLLTSYL